MRGHCGDDRRAGQRPHTLALHDRYGDDPESAGCDRRHGDRQGNSVLFTPASGASGAISFNYRGNYHLTSDAADVSQSEAKITVTIIASAQSPVAGADTASTPFNTAVLIDVLSNDSDPDIPGGGAQTLTVSNLTKPANGGAVEQVGNQVRYTPAQDFSGSDSFQYTVTDACGATAVGTVSVTVLPAPPPPPPLLPKCC